jgi:hypothetical protein
VTPETSKGIPLGGAFYLKAAWPEGSFSRIQTGAPVCICPRCGGAFRLRPLGLGAGQLRFRPPPVPTICPRCVHVCELIF